MKRIYNNAQMGFSLEDLTNMSKNFVGDLKQVAQNILSNERAKTAAQTVAVESQKELSAMKAQTKYILIGAAALMGVLILKRK